MDLIYQPENPVSSEKCLYPIPASEFLEMFVFGELQMGISVNRLQVMSLLIDFYMYYVVNFK